jgi:hypothetical protein
MNHAKWLVVFVTINYLGSYAQKNELNLVFGGGVNYIFADQIKQHRLGGTFFSGVNFIINKHNRGILFNPGFYISGHTYTTKLSESFKARLNENMIGINLDVLLRISRKNYFRLGIHYCRQTFAYPEIDVRNNNTQVYSYSGDDLYKNFSPYVYQAKIVAGICVPVKLRAAQSHSRTKLNLLLIQNAIPLLNKPYELPTYQSSNKKVVWSQQSYPTSLVASLEINLLGKKAVKSSEEE